MMGTGVQSCDGVRTCGRLGPAPVSSRAPRPAPTSAGRSRPRARGPSSPSGSCAPHAAAPPKCATDAQAMLRSGAANPNMQRGWALALLLCVRSCRLVPLHMQRGRAICATLCDIAPTSGPLIKMISPDNNSTTAPAGTWPMLQPGLAVAPAGGPTAIPTSLCRTPQDPVLPAPTSRRCAPLSPC